MARKSIFIVAINVMLVGVMSSVPIAQGALTGTAESYPALITVEDLGPSVIVINPNEGTKAEISCNDFSGSGTVEEKGVEDTEVTVSALISGNCSATIGESTLPMTIDTTGCDYLVHGGEADAEHHFTNGLIDITCPGNVTGPVAYVYQNSEHKTKVCTYNVWSFSGHSGGEAENNTGTPDTVTIALNGLTLPITRTQGLLCPKPTEEAAAFGEALATGYKDLGGEEEGAPIGITLSEAE